MRYAAAQASLRRILSRQSKRADRINSGVVGAAVQRIKADAPVASGELKSSVGSRKSRDGVEIFVSAPHAKYQKTLGKFYYANIRKAQKELRSKMGKI